MDERPYQKLVAWKEADALCLFTYEVTRKFPPDERFALVQQMRRSSYGIPMCIVEGNSRKTVKDRQNFFTMALASLEELHYQYSLALRLKYINQVIFEKAEDHIKRTSFLLRKLHDSLS
jgi:four helix bundle protein